jgi:N6-L-threonylcarbamoyladenine synthase
MTHHALTVLGIESSCDETAVALVRQKEAGDTEVLASLVYSQVAAHAAYGGVVPEIAARAHLEVIDVLCEQALIEAQTKDFQRQDIDLVAATAGPGLIGGVMVGLNFAKGFALARNLPLVAVNHLEGHALSVRLTHKVEFPYLLLLVSGGHCQLLCVKGLGDYERLGTTIDDAAGEAFDKIAKTLGLGYPGGPALEACAKDGNPSRFALPRALLGRKDCDFSFSGLKTAAAKIAFEQVKTQADRADLCAGVQAAITRQLCERSIRALEVCKTQFGAKTFVVAGGVAANQTVRDGLKAAAESSGFDFIAPPLAYCTDNAAMIALTGLEYANQYLNQKTNLDAVRFGAEFMQDGLLAKARPRWPLDEQKANAMPVHRLQGRKGAKA